MTELLSRKDRERQAKRQDILKAARVVFAEKGLHAATLDEIAEKAEFAKGTLYTYFQNKEDLFVSMLEQEILDFHEELKQVLARDLPPAEILSQLVRAMMAAFDQNMDLMRLLSQERSALATCRGGDQMEARFLPHFHRLNAAVASLVRRGIAQGAFRRVDPERAATAVFNLCHGAAMASYLNKKRIDSPEEAAFITGLLLQGIAAGK
ncbi:TetR/AcrR family transcriptional regulator [bacterium]|nr:TetR/AcrR family transcriptional regulator [bacterium]